VRRGPRVVDRHPLLVVEVGEDARARLEALDPTPRPGRDCDRLHVLGAGCADLVRRDEEDPGRRGRGRAEGVGVEGDVGVVEVAEVVEDEDRVAGTARPAMRRSAQTRTTSWRPGRGSSPALTTGLV
jgi:hypothetical protein